MKKIPEDLKTELFQIIFWAIVFGIVLGVIVFSQEFISVIECIYDSNK